MLRTKFQWLIAAIVCILLTGYFHNGKKINGVIWSDQEGYYIYLPALFIDGFEDVKCANGCTTVETDNGPRIFTKYTYGVAFLESPFFLTAHAIAPIIGFARDGRSLPYIWAVMLAAIFYMLAGLTLISRVLDELKFSKPIQWLVPVGMLLGTNLFYYTFREAGMSHVYSFFLMALLIYAAHRKSVLDAPRWDFLSAMVLALIILIRPTNAIAILIPVLWNAQIRDIPSRVKEFLTNGKWLVSFSVSLVIFFLPQLFYWKMVTGNYLFYSYGDEGFIYWNSPKMLQVLFSPQNGWLVYSPIMLTSLYGLFLMIRNKTTGWLLPTSLLLLATYVFGSWWAWWFGGAYGHRCFVDYLPILAIPSAVAIKQIAVSQKALKIALVSAAVLAIYVNIRMCDIYHGMWDGDWTWFSYLEKLKSVFYLL